jgi:hypothetical protein
MEKLEKLKNDHPTKNRLACGQGECPNKLAGPSPTLTILPQLFRIGFPWISISLHHYFPGRNGLSQ